MPKGSSAFGRPIRFEAPPARSATGISIFIQAEMLASVAKLTAVGVPLSATNPETPDRLRAESARVLGNGEPRLGAHDKPVLFLHPKDFCGTLIELEQA